MIVLAMNRPAADFAFKWCDLIYTEAFKRIGVAVRARSFPLARASAVADKGEVDGEPVRIYTYQFHTRTL